MLQVALVYLVWLCQVGLCNPIFVFNLQKPSWCWDAGSIKMHQLQREDTVVPFIWMVRIWSFKSHWFYTFTVFHGDNMKHPVNISRDLTGSLLLKSSCAVAELWAEKVFTALPFTVSFRDCGKVRFVWIFN